MNPCVYEIIFEAYRAYKHAWEFIVRMVRSLKTSSRIYNTYGTEPTNMLENLKYVQYRAYKHAQEFIVRTVQSLRTSSRIYNMYSTEPTNKLENL